MKTLQHKWLCDKSSALCAAILASTDLDAAHRGERKRLENATRFIAANVTTEHVGFLTDATLALLENVPHGYIDGPDEDLLPDAVPLGPAMALIQSELESRNVRGERIAEILIAHAVYVLKQPHLSIRDFIKWFKRCKESETGDLRLFLKDLDDSGRIGELDALLDLSRDASQQTRDRIDAVDCLYDALVTLAGPMESTSWWLRICLALRTSLYCWPLMVAGSEDYGLHGMSLPIGMFLSQDGKSRVYFKIVNPRNSAEHRRYVRGSSHAWAHMEESQLHWDEEWERAFHMGLRVAKTLWSTQNGRMRFVDETAAGAMMKASLVVDMGAACAIVDGAFNSADGTPYCLSGRSAEAYWVQAVLGMLLPGGEIPLGVVTGRIQMVDGIEEIHRVNGIDKKLEYANNAGFSRIVLPLERPHPSTEVNETVKDLGDTDGELTIGPGLTIANAVSAPQGGTPRTTESTAAQMPKEGSVAHSVRLFLQSLAASGTRKRVEINFCRSVRNVADAMQVSGWRRAAFVRLPETQRAFANHLRRLFLLEKVNQRASLATEDRRDYDRNPWTEQENRLLRRLDDYLLSDTRAIKFVNRATFDEVFVNGAEAEIGRWLAWKDHQVRGGWDINLRGPALGVLCIRTSETDNEIRLWSAIADMLSASPAWWNAFQWSSVSQAAHLLARLLGNRRANPEICATPAPDLLVLFDEGNLTQRRTNPIFPDYFRGQWIDLLNPSKDNPNAAHLLNEALIREGGGIQHPHHRRPRPTEYTMHRTTRHARRE